MSGSLASAVGASDVSALLDCWIHAGVTWSELTSRSQRDVLVCFTAAGYSGLRFGNPTMPVEHLVESMLGGLAMMGATWPSLPTRPRNRFAIMLADCRKSERAAVENGLYRLRAETRMLPKALRDSMHSDSLVSA
jgi:hypothetical protein